MEVYVLVDYNHEDDSYDVRVFKTLKKAKQFQLQNEDLFPIGIAWIISQPLK